MNIEATTLEELLRNCRNIKIPFYQRGYSWDKENVEKLLSDIYYSKTQSYFLGSIILKNGKGHSNIIVDGQQRISTILLIYKIIWKYCDLNSNEIKIKLDNWYNEIKFDSANLKDGKSLSKIMDSHEELFDQETLKSKYYENYQVIDDFVKNKPDKEVVIKKLYDQLEKVLLSEVIIDDDADEHVLFSQINSTGKILSAFDLVKNYLFSHISNELEGDPTKQGKISKMLKKLDKVSDLKSKDDVIRHFIGFKTSKLPNKNSKTIYQSFEDLYKKNYHKNSQSLFVELYEFFFYYNYLEKKEWEGNFSLSPILNTLIESIGTYAILIITFFSKNSQIKNEEITMTSDQLLIIKNSLLILESYKFKREFYSLSEKTITRFIPLIANNIMKEKFDNFNTDIMVYFFLVHEPSIEATYRMPSDSEFKQGMKETRMYKKIAKLFLYRISTFLYKDTPDAKPLTIEHVIPQDQKKWIENGYLENQELILSKIHTIGNLTLTAYNSELSNNVFEFKKNLFRKNDNFPLNKYFIDPENEIKEWNTQEIEKRSNVLFQICQDIWSFDNYEKIIDDNQVLNSFEETPEVTKKKMRIDFAAKNSNAFNSNKSYFKPIKDLIDQYHIEFLLKNLMVYGVGTEKNETKVFGVERRGWVSQSIYDFLGISSSSVKGKYDESQFNDYIKSNTKYIDYLIDYFKEELS